MTDSVRHVIFIYVCEVGGKCYICGGHPLSTSAFSGKVDESPRKTFDWYTN